MSVFIFWIQKISSVNFVNDVGIMHN